MTTNPDTRTESQRWNNWLRYIAGGLAFAVAGIHLLHPSLGIQPLTVYLRIGSLNDPRPLAFVVSALVICIGIYAVMLGIPRKPIYLLGMFLTLTYIFGYIAWHTILEHGGFWPQVVGFTGASSPIDEVISHLRHDMIDLASKLLELALLVVLAVLYYRE